MARILRNIKSAIAWGATLQNDVEGTPSAQFPASLDFTPSWQSGTGSLQADRVWYSEGRVLAAAASENIDLYDFGSIDIGAGAGKDALGQSMALAEIALIAIQVTAGGKLRIGGEGSGAAWNSGFGGSDTAVSHDVGANGLWALIAGNDGDLPVADTTNHLLKLLGVTAQVTYNVLILGRSA